MSTKIPLPFLSHGDRLRWGEFERDFEGVESEWQPLVDVFDSDEFLIIEVDLPGIQHEDLELSVEDQTLKISGQRSARESSLRGVINERGFGRFQRIFSLPPNIESENAAAQLANGVLRITFLKQGQCSWEPSVVNSQKMEMEKNYKAYLEEKPQLEARFAGHVVAYFDGRRIDQEIESGRDFMGNPIKVYLVYVIDATIELLEEDGTVLVQKRIERLRLPVINNNGLLGRDILNQTICMLDGPAFPKSIGPAVAVPSTANSTFDVN